MDRWHARNFAEMRSMHNFTLPIVIALVAGIAAAIFSTRKSRRSKS